MKNHLKTFVLPLLSHSEIKSIIQCNYPDFPFISLSIDYDETKDNWRFSVHLKPDRFPLFMVCLQSTWKTASSFYVDYEDIKEFIEKVDELPF